MLSEKLLQFFPTPKFLNIPCAGVSISDSFVRMIQFENDSGGKLKIKKYAEKSLPIGAIVAGRLNNREEIIHTLESLRKETGIENIRVSIPEEKAYLFETTIPLVQSKDIRDTIEFKIEENVPLPTSDVLFDYVLLQDTKITDHLDVVVSALPSKFVDIYMDLIHSAGLKVYSMEVESQTIARSLLSKDQNGAYVILHFGAQKASIYIVYNRVVRFTSTTYLSEGWENDLSDIVSDTQKVINYWQTNKNYNNENKTNNSIAKILVCGDGFSESICSQLSSFLKIEVVLSDVWRNAFDIKEVVPKISFMDSLRYASAVGLALPPEYLI